MPHVATELPGPRSRMLVVGPELLELGASAAASAGVERVLVCQGSYEEFLAGAGEGAPATRVLSAL